MNTLIVADRFLKDNKLKALDKNEKYIISKSKDTKNKPQFLMIGKGINMRQENMAIDLLKEVSEMNAPEKFAFFAIRDAMDYNDETLSNIVVNQKCYNPYQKKMFQAGTKMLIDRKLIARVKRGIYQINPYAVIPIEFDRARDMWIKLVKYKGIEI